MLQVMGLLQVVVHTAASKLDHQPQSEQATANAPDLSVNEASADVQIDPPISEPESKKEDKCAGADSSTSDGKKSVDTHNIFLQLPQPELRNLCSILGREGYYSLIYISGWFRCSLTFYYLVASTNLFDVLLTFVICISLYFCIHFPPAVLFTSFLFLLLNE
jgi:hypothetical protein